MPVFALMLCVSAFACLAMAMERHQETLFSALLSVAVSRAPRCAGWCALLVALWLAVAGRGWALGLVV